LVVVEASEQAAERFFKHFNLRAERFTKQEMTRGKTPDFRVFSAQVLAFYCEAKHAQHDECLDKLLEKAQPLELVGGLRNDPIFNRLCGHIHEAAKQFSAVNPNHEYPNILFLTNSDHQSDIYDLTAVLDGNFRSADGELHPIYKQYSEGRIKNEKFTMDLFLWWNDWMSKPPQRVWLPSPHHNRLCELLGWAPRPNCQL
jgi:hypothetical protein